MTQLGLDLARDSLPAAQRINSTLQAGLFRDVEMAFLETSRSQLADLLEKVDGDALMAEAHRKETPTVYDLQQQLKDAVQGK
jgi:hypothetical protein